MKNAADETREGAGAVELMVIRFDVGYPARTAGEMMMIPPLYKKRQSNCRAHYAHVIRQ